MTDDAASGRLHLRYRVQMAVEVYVRKRWETLQSDDVGTGGLFLRTQAPAAPRQLVQIKADLPFDMGSFKATTVVARAVGANDPGGAIPGMGITFYALGKNEQELWDRFLKRVAVECPGTSEKPLVATPSRARPPDALLGPTPNLAAVLDVPLGAAEDLFVVYSRDVSRGGMFLATEAQFDPGQPLALRLVHAPSRTEVWLRCEVRRVVRSRSARGLGVEIACDEAEQRALRESLGVLIDAADEEIVASQVSVTRSDRATRRG